MTILFVTHYPDLYGANRSMLGLMEQLRQRGIQLHVLVPQKGRLTDALDALGFTYHTFPFHLWMSDKYYSGRFYHRIRQYMGYRQRAKRYRKENLVLLETIARQMKGRDIDLVYSNSSVINIGFLLSQKLGVPHIWHFREFGYSDYRLTGDYSKRELLFSLRSSHAVIAISEAIRQHILSKGDPGNISVIYNGVFSASDVEQIDRKNTAAEKTKPCFTFGIIGLIQPAKGQAEAVEAFSLVQALYPHTRLLIAGNGQVKPIEELVSRLNLHDKVVFTGYVDDPFEVYAACDVVLMCSRSEAMGRVTVEAMAAARPVIGYDAGATSELIRHEVDGFLYRNGATELAGYMSLLAADGQRCKKMGEAARIHALKNFTVEQYADQVLNIIQKTGLK